MVRRVRQQKSAEEFSHKKAHKAQNETIDFKIDLYKAFCAFCAFLWPRMK
jgi:hypothetical protein